MGSFDYTCAISNLPITAGDEIRFILLQSSPFNRRGHYANGPEVWYVRAPPIRAKYNDYGSIDVDSIHPEDEVIAQLWLQGLKLDLLEKGVGDNIYHDVAVRKDMTFEQLLEALWEHRVEVKDDLGQEKIKKFKLAKLAQGIPSLRRVEKIISKATDVKLILDGDYLLGEGGTKIVFSSEIRDKLRQTWKVSDNCYFLNISQLGTQDGQFIVDKLCPGEIRVRLGGHPGLAITLVYLNALAKRLSRKYAVMVSCGSGRYSNCAELMVHPKPGTQVSGGTHLFSFSNEDVQKRSKTLQVRTCMVREDVWQALLTMGVEDWGENSKIVSNKIIQYQIFAKEAWQTWKDFDNTFVKLKSLDFDRELIYSYSWRDWGNRKNNPVVSWISENPSISAFGMNYSWHLMAKIQSSEKVAENFCNIIAETALISGILRSIRMTWKPEETTSPQFGEWFSHRNFHQKIIKCTATPIADIKRQRKENQKWEREYQKKLVKC